MKVTVIPIVIGELWTIPNGLVKGVEDMEVKEQVKEKEEKKKNTDLRTAKRMKTRSMALWDTLLVFKYRGNLAKILSSYQKFWIIAFYSSCCITRVAAKPFSLRVLHLTVRPRVLALTARLCILASTDRTCVLDCDWLCDSLTAGGKLLTD